MSSYDANKILGFRKLKSNTMLTLLNPILKKGNNEKTLLDSLKQEDFDCNITDGDFESKTSQAVKSSLQAYDKELANDGIYGSKTKNLLFELMNE